MRKKPTIPRAKKSRGQAELEKKMDVDADPDLQELVHVLLMTIFDDVCRKGSAAGGAVMNFHLGPSMTAWPSLATTCQV